MAWELKKFFEKKKIKALTYCIPCDRMGPRLPAFGFCQDCNEHLCQTCFSHHKKATPSMHHVLLDYRAMPESMNSSSKSAPVSRPDDYTQPCLKHKKKMIEYYCQDHRVLLCSVCVTLEHTVKACLIDYIPDISGQVVDSQELNDILERMDTIIQNCRGVKEICKRIIEKSNSSLTDVLKDIKKYRQGINKRIDELENAVQTIARALQQQNDKRLETTEVVCDGVIESMKALSGNIERSNATKQADKLFIELKTAEVMIKEHDTFINGLLPAEEVKAYYFKSNTVIPTVLENEKSLGTLEQKIISKQYALKPQH